MVRNLEGANKSQQMEINMSEIGIMIKNTESGNTRGKMVADTMANGLKENKKEWDVTSLQIKQYSTVSGKMIEKKVMVRTNGLMDALTPAGSNQENKMDSVSSQMKRKAHKSTDYGNKESAISGLARTKQKKLNLITLWISAK